MGLFGTVQPHSKSLTPVNMPVPVGAIIGFIFGSVNIMRYGAGPNGVGRTLGQYMMGSGATFVFFMSIGSMIRTDTISQEAAEAFARSKRRPLVMPRQAYRQVRD